MRIGIDASTLLKEHRTGKENHIVRLVRHLAEIDQQNAYYICYRVSRLRRSRACYVPGQGNFHRKLIQEPLNLLFERRLDVFHGPELRLPKYRHPALVSTLHDLFSVVSENFGSAEFREKKKIQYQSVIARAARIICISDHTRRDAIRHLDVPEEKLVVVHEGIGEQFQPQGEDEHQRVREKYGLGSDFALYVGGISKRKNTQRLLEAFALVAREHDGEIELVLGGREGYGHEEVMATYRSLGIEDRCRFIGFIPEDDLPALYSAARLFVFPSLYEGFGHPVLEAMACGTPVVSSAVSAIPELAGDDAVLVDPLEARQIADGILRVLSDSQLSADLVERGKARAKLFPWTETARKTLDVYREAAEARR